MAKHVDDPVKVILDNLMEAQADLQTRLGLYRLDHGRGDPIERRLSDSLARIHGIMAGLGRPMHG